MSRLSTPRSERLKQIRFDLDTVYKAFDIRGIWSSPLRRAEIETLLVEAVTFAIRVDISRIALFRLASTFEVAIPRVTDLRALELLFDDFEVRRRWPNFEVLWRIDCRGSVSSQEAVVVAEARLSDQVGVPFATATVCCSPGLNRRLVAASLVRLQNMAEKGDIHDANCARQGNPLSELPCTCVYLSTLDTSEFQLPSGDVCYATVASELRRWFTSRLLAPPGDLPRLTPLTGRRLDVS